MGEDGFGNISEEDFRAELEDNLLNMTSKMKKFATEFK